MRRRCLFAIGFAVCTAVGAADTAYPTRPVRLIVGYPPGGSTDIAARMIGQRLAPIFQQTVVIDNRAGASGGETAQSTSNAAGKIVFMD